MKAYIVQDSTRTIEPFKEHPGNCLIGNKSLNKLQQEVSQRLNLKLLLISDVSEISDADEYIVFGDNVYFTEELLIEFISKSRHRHSNTICSLKSGITTLRTVTVTQNVKTLNDRVEYDLHYVPKREFRGEKYPIVINPDEISEGIPMPEHMCGSDKYHIPITEKLIAQIDHWTNLWSINIALSLSGVARLQKSIKSKIIFALRACSLNRWKVLHKLNKIGKNCDIHPTAYMEGSIIGDSVTVGAGSIIKESIIGDGAYIGNRVAIETSVVGKKCTILHGHIMYSVLYPYVFNLTQMISASMIGRDAFVGSGVVLTDYRFDKKNIVVIKDNTKIDTKNRFIGSCLGHGVYLGSGCIIAPGRMVPNGVHVIPEKGRVIETFKDSTKISGFRIV